MTDAFEERYYDVSVEQEKLLLCTQEKELVIPLRLLRQFSVYGKTEDPRQFMLVTGQEVYHGDFPSREDMEQMLDALKCAAGQRIEINLNME